MVYEEPLPTFYSRNKNDELDKLVSLSHTRWRHIHKIHCVFPNGTGQIVGAKSLDATHYQSFYANFLEAIQGYYGEIEAIVYLPDDDESKVNTKKTIVDHLFPSMEFDEDMNLIKGESNLAQADKVRKGKEKNIQKSARGHKALRTRSEEIWLDANHPTEDNESEATSDQ
jgi:hypothetical protein